MQKVFATMDIIHFLTGDIGSFTGYTSWLVMLAVTLASRLLLRSFTKEMINKIITVSEKESN